MMASSGGQIIANTLRRHGVRTLFALCGGHIAPILVGARQAGIRVVDTRHEAAATFAADAEARLTGRPGVVAVTAGPGVTNAVTALKNARLANSPLVILCGATATVLKGRGALQDIDQSEVLAAHVKWFAAARRVREVDDLLCEAFSRSLSGVPGPVAVEYPVDLLYPEHIVREWYGVARRGGSLAARAERGYLSWHLRRQFAQGRGGTPVTVPAAVSPSRFTARRSDVDRLAERLQRSRRPVVLIGSQAMVAPDTTAAFAAALEGTAAPVYLSGMARGLLGAAHPLQRRHDRKSALREADLVVLAGVPCDFRLDYGRHIGRSAAVVAIGRNPIDLRQNRTPTLAIQADPDLTFSQLAERGHRPPAHWHDWSRTLNRRDADREGEIDRRAAEPADLVNPLALCRAIDQQLTDKAVVVADGGDFVATASYVLRPRGPLSWLDPGVFGTLGVGGGFVAGVHAARPDADIWLLWGDGAAGYSLAELDTFVRHQIGVVAVVGNDASWAQIARDQVAILGEATGTVLRRTDYESVARGWGGEGFRLERTADASVVLAAALDVARSGRPALVNAILAPTDFRKGSMSL